MSRQTQFYGISKQAVLWLKKNAKVRRYTEKITRTYEDGATTENTKEGVEIVQTITDTPVEGMFGEVVHKLKEYEMPDGGIVEEYIQAQPWAGGPCIFLALRFKETQKPVRKSLWPDNTIRNI